MNVSNIKKTSEQLAALKLVLRAGDDLRQALGLTAPELIAAQMAHDQTADAISAKAAALAQVAATSQAKLAAVGFPLRRSGTPRPATPQPATGLAATHATDGTVRLA